MSLKLPKTNYLEYDRTPSQKFFTHLNKHLRRANDLPPKYTKISFPATTLYLLHINTYNKWPIKTRSHPF
ncbi:hypothetical protein [Okeania sp. SIO3B5]|uniref:hypothetical protein n=1 Tax=Okeania sp. SIO3B5 TaxID=2607811 RepID=UPI0025EC4ADD|nr:hypothetical protein [Okeania sp. SIO3B5]